MDVFWAILTALGIYFSPAPASAAQPQVDMRELQPVIADAFAANQVEGPSVALQNDTLVFKMGGLKSPPPSDLLPIDFIMTALFRIEAIKRDAGNLRAYADVASWRKAAADAEPFLAQEIALLDDRSTKIQVRRKLRTLDRQITDVLKQPLIVNRGGHSVAIGGDRGGDTFEVKVVLKPSGAVYYTSVLQYRILQSLHRENDRRHWHEFLGSPLRIAGAYYFYVRWPDGRDKLTGIVDISANKTISLSP